MSKISKQSLTRDLSYDIYLNYAAVSPPIPQVQAAITECMTDYAQRGVGAVMQWIGAREDLRTSLATHLRANDPDEFAFVANTSTGAICIANSVDWTPGGRIVLFDQEFPTNTVPWQRAAETYGLDIVWASTEETVTSGGENLEEVIDERTQLVAVSAVQFQTGWRMPVDAISRRAKQYGALTFVDAIQACGVVPVSFEEWDADFVACGGHKWMMGLEGAGFLWCHQRTWEEFVPRLAGWLSTTEPLTFLFEGPGELRYDRPMKSNPQLFEFGAANALGYAALGASVNVLQSIGRDVIWSEVSAWLDHLEAGFKTRGVDTTRKIDAASGILSVRPPAGMTVEDVVHHFADHDIAVSSPDGYVRFAPHWPNEVAQTDRVLEVWDTLSRS